MPFIHVKSLSLPSDTDLASLVEGLSHDFAGKANIDVKHVTVTWEIMNLDAYAVGGKVASRRGRGSFPVLVDILAPDFNSPAKVREMLRVVAGSISTRIDVSIEGIFVNYRQAHSGMVFDAGDVVEW